MKFVKIEAAGNDFVFIDGSVVPSALIQEGVSSEVFVHWVRKICDRHFGVGADGLVILDMMRLSECRVRWDFLNCDGSLAQMCGNAARGVGLYLKRFCEVQWPIRLATLSGDVVVSLVDNDRFSVGLVGGLVCERILEPVGQEGISEILFAETGVPHVVVVIGGQGRTSQWPDQERDWLMSVAKALRFHPRSGPAGNNVTFVVDRGQGRLEAVSYERGVEGLTLACGTGALAAALVMRTRQEALTRETLVSMPGGLLTVRWPQEGADSVNPRGDGGLVELIGSAHLVYSGTLDSEQFTKP